MLMEMEQTQQTNQKSIFKVSRRRESYGFYTRHIVARTTQLPAVSKKKTSFSGHHPLMRNKMGFKPRMRIVSGTTC